MTNRAERRIDALALALESTLEAYVAMANSGSWDPEEEGHVMAARSVLKSWWENKWAE
jgi:hypothetical protein